MLRVYLSHANGVGFNLSNNENMYQIIKVSGIDAADRSIIWNKTTLKFGGTFEDWSINDREITIEVKINGDTETNRNNLLSFLTACDSTRILLSTPQKQLYIDTYLSGIDYDVFSQAQKMNITFLAPYPYFSKVYNALDPNDHLDNTLQALYAYYSGLDPLDSRHFPAGFTFPENVNPNIIKAIRGANPLSEHDYNITVTKESGVIILLHGGGFTIKNDATGKKMGIKSLADNINSIVYIDTRPTRKNILLFDGASSVPAANLIKAGSEWLLAEPGLNHFEIIFNDVTTAAAIIGYFDDYDGI